MSARARGKGGGGDELRAEVRELRDPGGDRLELVLALANPTDRTLHYIGDVRAIDWDPATRRLRLRMSDRGRAQVPGGMYVLPRFRSVEPGSEASVEVSLPRRIVRLAPQDPPTAAAVFEEHTIADADEVEVEIGWSRTPFYSDPRGRGRPLGDWEEGTARAATRMRGEGAS